MTRVDALPDRPDPPGARAPLDPPLALHRAGESALLAEYPGTRAVLAAAASVRELAPAHLIDLVPAERTLLLVGTAARDLPDLAALLRALPVPSSSERTATEVALGIVYDGEDLDEVAELLGMSTPALVAAHSATRWSAAFGGFAPGFSYLLPEIEDAPGRPPWEVPRRAAPRTAVPAGAVGLASRYCAIYPRSSPGGWQLIGRSDAVLFDVDHEPPALLTPGTRVRFVPQRPTVRVPAPATALAQVTREAAAVRDRLGMRRAAAPSVRCAHPALEVLQPGPHTLLEDTGRPGRAGSGVSRSGAFDRGAMLRANLAVGNPAGAAVLEGVAGPLRLRALAATVVALSGARAPLALRRADGDCADLDLPAEEAHELPIALDPGDLLELGPAEHGLRLVLAVRGGVRGIEPAGGVGAGGAGAGGADASGPVLGSLSHDLLSALGPAPLAVGDRLLVGPERGLDAVPAPVRTARAAPAAEAAEAAEVAEVTEAVAGAQPPAAAGAEPGSPDRAGPLEVPVHAGPRDGLLGEGALAHLMATAWTVRPDSDRVGVRLEGVPLAPPSASGTLASEPMVPGAIQVPPSGLPVVFGPDHPTTGGYPVIAVVTQAGLDALAQAAAGTTLRFVPA